MLKVECGSTNKSLHPFDGGDGREQKWSWPAHFASYGLYSRMPWAEAKSQEIFVDISSRSFSGLPANA